MVLCLVIVGGTGDVMQCYCVLPSLVVQGMLCNGTVSCHRWWYRGCNAMVLCLVIVGGRWGVMQWYCVLPSLVVDGV